MIGRRDAAKSDASGGCRSTIVHAQMTCFVLRIRLLLRTDRWSLYVSVPFTAGSRYRPALLLHASHSTHMVDCNHRPSVH